MPRKRSNGEGSIFYNDARNRWEAKLYITEPDGRRRRKILTAKTRKAVAARLDEVKAAVEQGLAPPDNTTTVADYAAWWIENVLPGEGLAPATERWYRDIITHYVTPNVDGKTLTGPRALTPSDVEAIAVRLEQAGLSHKTVVATRTTLGKVLRDAGQRGLVARNVARLAKPPRDRGRAREVRALTSEQVAELLDGLDEPWLGLAMVHIATGLRPGELLALHWQDIHLDGPAPYLSVRLSLSHATGGPVLKAPKRPRSYRSVPLPPEAVDTLRRRRKTQAADRLAVGPLWSDAWPGLAFTSTVGEPMRVDSYRHALGRAVRGVHPHRMRHSYATHLLESGTPIHQVAEILGDSVTTIESTYAHSLRVKSEAAEVIRSIFPN